MGRIQVVCELESELEGGPGGQSAGRRSAIAGNTALSWLGDSALSLNHYLVSPAQKLGLGLLSHHAHVYVF